MTIKDVFSLKVRDIFSLIISLPITIYVNFRCLPFKMALKLPIFVGYKTHIDKLSRNIRFGCVPTTFMVRIGWGGTEGREAGKKNYLLLNDGATMNWAPASIAPLQVSASNTEPAPITTFLFPWYFSTKDSMILRAPGTV